MACKILPVRRPLEGFRICSQQRPTLEIYANISRPTSIHEIRSSNLCRCSGHATGQQADVPRHSIEGLESALGEDDKFRKRLNKVREAAAVVAKLAIQKDELVQESATSKPASAWEIQDQAQKVAERGADRDVLTAADNLEQAQAELYLAIEEQSKRSVSFSKETERLKSVKAGAISALSAAAASAPFLLTTESHSQILATRFGILLVSGFLFGVTYRYGVRQELNNVPLKSGIVGAFGIVRGMALSEAILNAEVNAEGIASVGIVVGESMLIFGFAAVALDWAFRKGIVQPSGDSS